MGTPKSHQHRDVSISNFPITDLAAHVGYKQPDDLVFGGIRSGQPLRVSTFRSAFNAAATSIGVPGLHPHELRHTAASLAIASGADVKVVQKMLGHASATMTLDACGHLFEDRLDDVAAAMDAARTLAWAKRDEAAAVANGRSAVANLLPISLQHRDGEGPLHCIYAGQGAFHDGSPDGIRTRATALRGRRARPLHNGAIERTSG
ncbi:MAG: hypothetical protein QOI51_1506 [Nocardioidaceae bacterium]|nr:hypothetical protein [Nocardioidaceae bacterium]